MALMARHRGRFAKPANEARSKIRCRSWPIQSVDSRSEASIDDLRG